MNIEEITEWIKNSKRLDIMHSYCSDILLIRKVTKGEITPEAYQKQLIINIEVQIGQLQVSMKENQDIVSVIKNPEKNKKFKHNVDTCTRTITELEKEIKEIQEI